MSVRDVSVSMNILSKTRVIVTQASIEMLAVHTGLDRDEPQAAGYKSQLLSHPSLVHGSFYFAISVRTAGYAVKQREARLAVTSQLSGRTSCAPKRNFCLHICVPSVVALTA